MTFPLESKRTIESVSATSAPPSGNTLTAYAADPGSPVAKFVSCVFVQTLNRFTLVPSEV